MGDFFGGLIGLALFIGIFILTLLACREIVAWYLKTNKRIELMEENNRLLKELLNKRDGIN